MKMYLYCYIYFTYFNFEFAQVINKDPLIMHIQHQGYWDGTGS